MSISIDWYIENEIIYGYVTDNLTSGAFREGVAVLQSLIESSLRPLVHIIIDVGEVNDSLPLKDALDIMRDAGVHDRTGWFIILRENSLLLKMSIAFGTSLFKMRTRTFDTMDETKTFLSEMDEMISWDKANQSIIKTP